MTTKEKVEQISYQYRVPAWSVVALINGDVSGMTDDDIFDIECFEDNVITKHGVGHWSYDTDEEPGIYRSNDIHNLGDNCLHVQYIVFNRES